MSSSPRHSPRLNTRATRLRSPKTDTVNLGVLGFGRMGAFHADSVAQSSGAALVAVCDSRVQARDRAIARHGVPALARVDDFLDIPMDGVLIASSTTSHAEHVQKCAEAGLAVFTEKPVGLSMRQADTALAAVVQAGVPFQIGYQRRWDPRYIAMKTAIDAGDIGEPLLFKAHGRDPDASSASNWGLNKNGGLFGNSAIHDFDAARFLLGREALNVTASGAVLVHKGLEAFDDLDTCSTSISFDGGAIALTEWTRFATYGYDVQAEVIGTEGVVQLGTPRAGGVTVRRRANTRDSVLRHFDQAYKNSVHGFAEAIRMGSEPTPGVHDARAALQLALLARQSQQARSARMDVTPLPPLTSSAPGR